MKPQTAAKIAAAVAFVATLVISACRPNAQPYCILEAALVALMAWAATWGISSTLEDYDQHNR